MIFTVLPVLWSAKYFFRSLLKLSLNCRTARDKIVSCSHTGQNGVRGSPQTRARSCHDCLHSIVCLHKQFNPGISCKEKRSAGFCLSGLSNALSTRCSEEGSHDQSRSLLTDSRSKSKMLQQRLVLSALASCRLGHCFVACDHIEHESQRLFSLYLALIGLSITAGHLW